MDKTFHDRLNISARIEVIPGGCPLCKGDVKGNDRYLFYCRRCNLLFRRKLCEVNQNSKA